MIIIIIIINKKIILHVVVCVSSVLSFAVTGSSLAKLGDWLPVVPEGGVVKHISLVGFSEKTIREPASH